MANKGAVASRDAPTYPFHLLSLDYSIASEPTRGRCKSGPSTFLLPKRRLRPSKLISGGSSSLILNGFARA
jgi:hypothetical protein